MISRDNGVSLSHKPDDTLLYRWLFIKDLLQCRRDPLHGFEFGSPSFTFAGVRVQGIIIKLVRDCPDCFIEISIDDGSSIIKLHISKELATFIDIKGLATGLLVDCIGELRLSEDGDRYVVAHALHIRKDEVHGELIRVLELIYLYKIHYFVNDFGNSSHQFKHFKESSICSTNPSSSRKQLLENIASTVIDDRTSKMPAPQSCDLLLPSSMPISPSLLNLIEGSIIKQPCISKHDLSLKHSISEQEVENYISYLILQGSVYELKGGYYPLNMFDRLFLGSSLRSTGKWFRCFSILLKPDDQESVRMFLKTIGRGCEEYVDKFQNLTQMTKLNGRELKAMEIPVRKRRWILNWLEKYRQGREICSIKMSRKNKKPGSSKTLK